MAAEISLPVPSRLDAGYLVLVTSPPPDPQERVRTLVAERLAPPLHELARDMLDARLAAVEARPIDDSLPLHELRLFGAGEDQLEGLRAASHEVLVATRYRPRWPPAHEWVGLAIALALARDLDGWLIDLHLPRLLSHAVAERALPSERSEFRLVDWIALPCSMGEGGFWFTSKGLARFGLPEIQTRDVPPLLRRSWTAAMSGLADRLLGTWMGSLMESDRPATVAIPAHISVTCADVARAYGREPLRDGEAVVRLVYEPPDAGGDGYLTAMPPEEFHGSPGEHLTNVCRALIGIEEEVREPADGEAMDRAITAARARLPEARERLLRGLPLGSCLVVKHRLEVPRGAEYVWAAVTSWQEPDVLRGIGVNDAEGDPTVRAGRPVAIEAASVIDWALLADSGEVVEGGWTDRVLREEGT